MDILYFISLVIVAIISVRELRKNKKFFILIVICLVFQGWYGYKEKISGKFKDFRNALYQDEILKKQGEISKDIREMKEKEKKGLLTDSDYSLYIVRYLESIDHTLKYAGGKDIREWITTYYDAVDKIPDYFTPQEWKESEKLIYESMLEEITGHFSMRGTLRSGMSAKLFEAFKSERERLLKAKEREFNK